MGNLENKLKMESRINRVNKIIKRIYFGSIAIGLAGAATAIICPELMENVPPPVYFTAAIYYFGLGTITGELSSPNVLTENRN